MAQMTSILTLITGPLYAISTSMQLSVLPHLTIYGDVKESDLKKGVTSNIREKLGLPGGAAKALDSGEKAIVEV